MQQHAIDGRGEAQLARYEEVVARVALVGAGYGDGVGDVGRRAAPFCKRFAACLGCEVDACFSEEGVEFVYGRRIRVAGEAGCPGADRGACLDASFSVDLKELL